MKERTALQNDVCVGLKGWIFVMERFKIFTGMISVVYFVGINFWDFLPQKVYVGIRNGV